jgi:hypothetical protein
VTTSTSTRNHTSATPGEYTVTLTATDNWGRTSTVAHPVTVS